MAKRFLSIRDLTHLPTPMWLIEGLFEVNSLVMLVGPPGNYKSFLVIDWVMSIVMGRKWHGRPTIPSRVLYCLGEGKASLLKRMRAWTHFHQATSTEEALLDENFRVTFDVPQMAQSASVTNLIAGLEAENFKPDVIVIDTFARSFVGLDENSQKDTGLWVEQADRLRQLGYTVIFLHHTARNTDNGLRYRGSSAIMGAMDTAFTLEKDYQMPSQSILKCVKQKDHDEGSPLYLQRVTVTPDPKEEGSIVLTPAVRVDERFTPEYERITELIRGLMSDLSYPDDASRAMKLAELTGITEAAAKTRISRARKK